jgi:predicted membrane protein
MGLALALIVMGVLILLDRIGAGYGLREGWPWIVVALGVGGIFRNRRSPAAWVTSIVGVLILGARYYSIHIRVPFVIKTYFLPILLIVIGLLWLWKYKKD